jgi:hypothetical protein
MIETMPVREVHELRQVIELRAATSGRDRQDPL